MTTIKAEMIRGDAVDLPLEDDTVDLVLTSPPYNVGIDYADVDDNMPLARYTELVSASAREIARTLKPGGRAFVNVAIAQQTFEDGSRGDLPGLWHFALQFAGLKYRETIIWNKGAGNNSTAWGSYRSPNAPNFRGRYEPVLVYFKDRWPRLVPQGDFNRAGTSDLTPDEWPHLTTNVWDIPPASSKAHPAVMPIALAKRVVKISTWPGDLVLDPFAGSGTTLRAAFELGRDAIGIEKSPTYVLQWHETGAQQTLGV
jgi:DNA modification methylase